MSKKKEKPDLKENTIQYELCSNVIKYNNETLYLNEILWEEGLTYEDVKDFVVKKNN